MYGSLLILSKNANPLVKHHCALDEAGWRPNLELL